MIILSEEQLEIKKTFIETNDNLKINAYPGTGKTFMIEQLVGTIHRNKTVLVLSFIKEITEEIKTKLSRFPNVKVTTLNSIGFSLCKIHNEKRYKYNQYIANNPNNKNLFSIKKACGVFEKGKSKKDFAELMLKVREIEKLVHFGRFYNKIDFNGLLSIVEEFNLSLDNESIQIAQQVIEQSNIDFDKFGWADFTDQIYQIVRCQLKPTKLYDYVIIDEAQDLNYITLLAIKNLGKRFIFVGDENQSILGFAGSNPNSMKNIENNFNTTNFQLTLTRRCPKNVCNFVNEIFNTNLQTNNNDGEIKKIGFDELKDTLQNGDVILARSYKGKSKEQKLLSVYFYLIANGIPTICIKYDPIEDIKKLYLDIVSYMEDNNQNNFEEGLSAYFFSQILIAKYEDKEDLILLEKSFYAFIKYLNVTNEEEFLIKINKLNFNPSNSVKLCSIHAAKGMEYNRVFLLNFSSFPYIRKGMTEWQQKEEKNLFFVALTRTKHFLGLVD